MDSLHNLGLANSYSFVPNCNRHTRNRLSKNNSRSLFIHGLHMLPHPDRRYRNYLNVLIRFP